MSHLVDTIARSIRTATRTWGDTLRTATLILTTIWLPAITLAIILAHSPTPWTTTGLSTATGAAAATIAHRTRPRNRRPPG